MSIILVLPAAPAVLLLLAQLQYSRFAFARSAGHSFMYVCGTPGCVYIANDLLHAWQKAAEEGCESLGLEHSGMEILALTWHDARFIIAA